MSRSIITLCSMIALVGCVPEIRTSPADVPDAGDLGPVLDLPTDQPMAEVAGDGPVSDQGDAGQPDVTLVDVQTLDVVNSMDVVNDAAPGSDASIDRTLPTEAAVPVDGGSDASVEDRSCGVCTAANAMVACIAGACRINLCNAGFGDCNSRYEDGCETPLDSVMNCGRCGTSCGVSALCLAGVCVSQRSCPTGPELGCGLVSVAGGTYPFGTTSASGSDGPITVSVSALLIDTHEVTVARFRRYWQAGHPVPTSAIRYPGGGSRTITTVSEPTEAITASGRTCTWSASPTGGESLPINCVNWETAMAFCAWDGGRLPTEAEYEFIAVGRSLAGTAVPRRYPWGDQAPMGESGARNCDRAQLYGCSGDDRSNVRRVGSFPSAGGIYDLSGNVAEWQADNGTNLASSDCLHLGREYVDPLCTAGMLDQRAARGGSFETNLQPQVLGAARAMLFSTSSYESLGFRCVRSP